MHFLISKTKYILGFLCLAVTIQSGVSCKQSQEASKPAETQAQTDTAANDAITESENERIEAPANAVENTPSIENTDAQNSSAQQESQDVKAEPEPPKSPLETALQQAQAAPNDPAKSAAYLSLLLESKQFETFRSFYRTMPYIVRSNPEIRALYYRSFNEDPDFTTETETIAAPVCDEISPLGGGTTLTFKFLKNGEKIGAFKPHQKRRNSSYRSEIASWRLNQLLQCDFYIPRNRAVRVEKQEFNRLYDLSKSPKRDSYRSGFGDLIWTKLKGTYVYGTLKDWVPDFTSFPIEFVALWRDWVGQENYVDTFPPLDKALEPIKKHDNIAHFYDDVMAQAGNLTTKGLADQISQLLTFDYLIGNWDRFSILREQRGRNCQFKDGRFVSIDNGASFVAVDMKYVTMRFNRIERFNRRFVEEIRMLDKEETFKILFPQQSKTDRANFAQFWQRRDEVLARIDALIQQYGEDKVLSF